jgi:hypothetical protein
MNEADISRYITTTFAGVDVVVAMDASFFYYSPESDQPPTDQGFYFATLVTSDAHDQFSDLNRPSVFRLNIGIGQETFRSLFGSPTLPSGNDSGSEASEYDFTALDRLMPHPVYGGMLWVCILNPSDETFATQVRPLLAEAYGRVVSKYDRRAARR